MYICIYIYTYIYNGLQRVAVCCSVLQCVAECCSVLPSPLTCCCACTTLSKYVDASTSSASTLSSTSSSALSLSRSRSLCLSKRRSSRSRKISPLHCSRSFSRRNTFLFRSSISASCPALKGGGGGETQRQRGSQNHDTKYST